MPTAKCPRCANPVTFAAGTRPVCPKCGYGARPAPAGVGAAPAAPRVPVAPARPTTPAAPRPGAPALRPAPPPAPAPVRPMPGTSPAWATGGVPFVPRAPPRKSRTALWVSLGVVGLLLLAGLAVGAYMLLGGA